MLKFIARNWFPLALIALFVFSLPGFILCILNLFGVDAEFNTWLQENFNLSYHLSLAPFLTILFLLLPLVIVILYFLKLKRKPLQVPSTYLWKKSIEDLHVNSLFQWLRENILLLIQVLAVMILIYSVLGIRFHGGTSQGKHYILIIDNSASMAATDVSPSRLEWAKQQALKEVEAADDDDYGMILVFNSKATTLQTYTNNKAKLRDAIKSIEQTERPTRIEEALSLAESLANPVRSTEDVAVQPQDVPEGQERVLVPVKGISAVVHLYSDGRYAKLTEASLANLAAKQTGKTLLGDLNLRYHRAGQSGADKVNNLGIVAFNAVRILSKNAKEANLDIQKLQVLLRLQNFRPEAAQAKVHLDVYAGGKIVHAELTTVLLPKREFKKADPESEQEDKDVPGENAANILLPPLDVRDNLILHARIDGANDQFPLDDQAWLVVGTVRKAKVLIVGPNNPVLDAFFEQEASLRLASTEQLSVADLGGEAYRKKISGGDVDLVIFDRCAPADEADMPQANAFFIDRPPPPWQRPKNTLKNPFLAVSKRDHPILRYLTTLWDVGVNEAFEFDVKKNLDEKVKAKFELPESDPNRRVYPPLTKLLESGGGLPLMFTMPRGAYTDLVMTFALVGEEGELMSNWPLQPSFPLFFRNVLYLFGNVDDAVRSVTVQPGEPMILRPEAGVQTLEITPPSGTKIHMKRGNRPDFVFSATDKTGVYLVQRDDGGVRNFSVNLLDANESNIEPRDEIRIGNERISAGQDRPQPRDLWKWILVLALVLLLVEWYIYTKRVAI